MSIVQDADVVCVAANIFLASVPPLTVAVSKAAAKARTKAASKAAAKAEAKAAADLPRSKVHVEEKTIKWFLVWSKYMTKVHRWSTYPCLRTAKMWAPDVFPATIHPDTPRKWSKMKGVGGARRGPAKKVDPAMVQKLATMTFSSCRLSGFACSTFFTRLWPRKAWTCVCKGSEGLRVVCSSTSRC
eukprot:1047683-Amphidinium_carterae.1